MPASTSCDLYRGWVRCRLHLWERAGVKVRALAIRAPRICKPCECAGYFSVPPRFRRPPIGTAGRRPLRRSELYFRVFLGLNVVKGVPRCRADPGKDIQPKDGTRHRCKRAFAASPVSKRALSHAPARGAGCFRPRTAPRAGAVRQGRRSPIPSRLRGQETAAASCRRRRPAACRW